MQQDFYYFHKSIQLDNCCDSISKFKNDYCQMATNIFSDYENRKEFNDKVPLIANANQEARLLKEIFSKEEFKEWLENLKKESVLCGKYGDYCIAHVIPA